MKDSGLKNYISVISESVGRCYRDCEGSCPVCVDDKCQCNKAKTVEWLKELAEYRRLEEEGLLLRLPCKVGTPVYMITQDCGGDTLDCRARDCENCSYLFSFVEENLFDTYMRDDIGKYVFLTKEDAEKAIASKGVMNG